MERREHIAVSAGAAGRATTLSALRANLFAVGMMIVATGVALPAHATLWGTSVWAELDPLLEHSYAVMLLVLVGLITAHEGLHALGFRVFAGVPWRSIRFGVNWRALAPYASTSMPMSALAYRRTVVLPGLVLGVLPTLLGIASETFWLTALGALMTGAAGGDAAALWAGRHVDGDARVVDSQQGIGCEVLPC